MSETEIPHACDVLVVGAGAAGLSAAHAFAAQGRSVIVVGKVETHLAGRTVALFEGSLRFFRALGLWEACEPHAAPMEGIRLIDDTGSMFPTEPKEFRSREIDLDAFGKNIENNALVAALAEAARRDPLITLVEGLLDGFELNYSGARARLAGGQWIDAKFIVAGEGRNSQARQVAGITVKTWTYPQTAITVLLKHEKPHHNISTEWHKRTGPFTLVPLQGRDGAPHRSSMVWLVAPGDALRLQSLSPEELAGEIQDQSHDRFGHIELDGPVGAFPMGALKTDRVTGRRLALIGEIRASVSADRGAGLEPDPPGCRQSRGLSGRAGPRRTRPDLARAPTVRTRPGAGHRFSRQQHRRAQPLAAGPCAADRFRPRLRAELLLRLRAAAPRADARGGDAARSHAETDARAPACFSRAAHR